VNRPVLWLLAGVPGAGRRTFFRRRLAPRCNVPWVDSQEILWQRWPADPGGHTEDAERAAAAWRDGLMAAGGSFILRLGIAGGDSLELIRRARRAGFRVVLIHVHVATPAIAVGRVVTRVRMGGHGIPEDRIRAEHPLALRNAVTAVSLIDEAFVYDNSDPRREHRFLLRFLDGRLAGSCRRASLPEWARQAFGELLPEGPARAHRAP